MIAVGNQGSAVDLAADLDAEDRDRLVADEADDAGGEDPIDMSDRLRIKQTFDRLPAGNDGAEKDKADEVTPARSSTRPRP